jgi:hypothetical protein
MALDDPEVLQSGKSQRGLLHVTLPPTSISVVNMMIKKNIGSFFF